MELVKLKKIRYERNLPFWVKEVDEPTVEIDWDNMEIFPGQFNTLFNPMSWDDPGEFMKVDAENIKSTKQKVAPHKNLWVN